MIEDNSNNMTKIVHPEIDNKENILEVVSKLKKEIEQERMEIEDKKIKLEKLEEELREFIKKNQLGA